MEQNDKTNRRLPHGSHGLIRPHGEMETTTAPDCRREKLQYISPSINEIQIVWKLLLKKRKWSVKLDLCGWFFCSLKNKSFKSCFLTLNYTGIEILWIQLLFSFSKCVMLLGTDWIRNNSVSINQSINQSAYKLCFKYAQSNLRGSPVPSSQLTIVTPQPNHPASSAAHNYRR